MAGVRKLNHIGIAVKSIDQHRPFYENVVGARYEGTEEVPSQKVKVGFFEVGSGDGRVRLELLEATAPDSPVAAFIEKRGEGLHHLAFSVDDLETRLREIKGNGVRLIDETPRPGAHGTRIAFLHPKSSGGVLTEFCEESGKAGEPSA